MTFENEFEKLPARMWPERPFSSASRAGGTLLLVWGLLGCDAQPLTRPTGTGGAPGGTGGAAAGTGGGAAGSRGSVTDAGSPIDAPWSGCPSTKSPAGTFSFVSSGNESTCGIQTDGSLACWGTLPPGLPESFPGTYKDVSKGGAICAVRSSGELVCWGNDRYFLPAPAGSFEQVAVGEEAACARRADQTVACWGNPVRAYYVPPAYTFESLTGGAYFVCGLAAIGHAAICWEPRVGAESVFGVQGPFTQVDTGRFFACGLRPDGSVSCWSASWPPGGAPDANSYGELQPVQGPFRELTVGEFHACGLRADGQVACWGADSYGQATPPAGAVFLQVSAGSYHTCGIVPDGSVTCWGGGASCGG